MPLPPNLPERLLPADALTQVCINSVYFLCKEASKRYFVNLTEEKWEEWKAEGGALHAITWLPATRADLRNMAVFEATTTMQIFALLDALLSVAQSSVIEVGPQLIFVAAFLGFSKKGYITQKKAGSHYQRVPRAFGVCPAVDTCPHLRRVD
ncbi:hypothetical protein MRX96_044370 [Rhipicephalus microplus]